MFNNLLPEGFRDDVTNQAAVEHKYKNIIINLFQSNGYELVKTPLIEYTENFTSPNSFQIQVNENQKNLSLRDDITMQISRLSNSRLLKKHRPLKLCYYGEVVRDQVSILRPERQFLQIGAECIGENSYFADVEMIELACKSLVLVGIKNISIELSSKIFLDSLFKNINNLKNINKIKSLIKKKDINNSLKHIDASDHQYLKDIFDCTGSFLSVKKNLDRLKINKINIKEIEDLNNIYNKISKSYPEIDFILDLTDNEDKNYHNSIRFTFFSKNIRGEIASGGRYLSNKGKIVENATGFTCYMDTIVKSSSNIEKIDKIMIPFDTSEKDKANLIDKNFIVEKYFGEISKIKDAAIKKDCQFCFINNEVIKIN